MPGEDLVAALNEYGKERNVGLHRQISGSVLEFSDPAVGGSRPLRMNEHDIAFLNFFFCFYQPPDGVAVAIDGNPAADVHDDPADSAVGRLQIGAGKTAHDFKMLAGKEMGEPQPIGISLMIGGDDVGGRRGNIFFPLRTKTDAQLCDQQAGAVKEIAGEPPFYGIFVCFPVGKIFFLFFNLFSHVLSDSPL